MSTREPLLNPVAIEDLRPTQMTVGMIEVLDKRKRWREAHGKHRAKFLGSHMIPVIKGPKARFYVIDHHHLARALKEEGQDTILVNVIADLSMLSRDEFWTYCDAKGWTHPYDRNGRRQAYDKIPASVAELADDPYRSLAGELRRAGGFAKDTTPFSEFLWANFLRSRVKRSLIDRRFGKALQQAMTLAKSMDANYLPGWCGPVTGA